MSYFFCVEIRNLCLHKEDRIIPRALDTALIMVRMEDATEQVLDTQIITRKKVIFIPVRK